MKNYIIWVCLLVSARLVDASVQSTTSQDKPSYVYVHFYKETQSVSTARVDNMPDPTCPVSQMVANLGENISCKWDDSGNGSYSDKSTATYNAYYRGAGSWYQQMDSTTTCNWPPGLTTQIQSDENVYGGGTGEPSISTNSYTNQIVPINQERCNMSVSVSLNEQQAWDYWPRETQWVGSGTHIIGIQMKLKTGGKATSKLRNVIGLSATAQQMIPPTGNFLYYCPEPYTADYTYDWLYGNSGPMVQPQNIRLGTYGTVRTNGVAYIVVPDNADIDITPYVGGVDDYTFNLGQPTKYHSYFNLFVEQANPGYSFLPLNPQNWTDGGHVSWALSTDVPTNILQHYVSTNLINYLGVWGFGPGTNDSLCSSAPGQVTPNNSSFSNIRRIFYIGFPNLMNALQYVKQTHDTPPAYCFSGINCAAIAVYTGHQAGVHALPEDQTAQNFGVDLIMWYPSPTITPNPFADSTDIFYSPY